MTDKIDILVIVAFVILIFLIALPNMCRKYKGYSRPLMDKSSGSSQSLSQQDPEPFIDEPYANEHFTAVQETKETDKTDYISGTDPMASYENVLRPRGSSKDFESLVYDNTTGSILTGSQFMETTGIVAPPWIAPAWSGGDMLGPSSKGEIDPSDYENDPRMLYNKCSLSCCSPQYPTPFQSNVDPFVCDKNGNSKYLATDYYCQNNTGGIGCLCATQSQIQGLQTGYYDSYVDSQKNE